MTTRRDILKGMMAGLAVPRLLTMEEVKNLAGDEPFLNKDPRWQMWLAPDGTTIDCPDGISMFSVSPSMKKEQTMERVYIDVADQNSPNGCGMLMLDLAMNSFSGVQWFPPAPGMYLHGHFHIHVSFRTVVSMLLSRE